MDGYYFNWDLENSFNSEENSSNYFNYLDNFCSPCNMENC
jgi:hypothetical protein